MPASAQILGTGLPASVRALIDSFQNRRAHTTTDRSLAKRLRRTVDQCGVEPLGLAFYVHNGAVSVYGTVPDESAREALLTVATSQPGVRRIVDHLVVLDPDA